MNLLPVYVMGSLLVGITTILAVADYFLSSHKIKQIKINDQQIIPLTDEKSLLDALSEEQLFIPSACGGKGTCGHCKVQVVSGGGDVLPTEEVHLSRGEKKEGFRLACQLKVKDDIAITIPEELMNVEEYTAEVVKLEELTHNIKHLKLKLLHPETISFKPGQYVQIMVPGFEEYRAYSVASSPGQKDAIEFTIRLIPGGLCTTFVHKALEIGDIVKFTGPYGDFYLQEETDHEIVCIAGGAGMAPIRSIVHYLKEKGMPRKVRYYFGARAVKDLFFEEELHSIEQEFPNFKYYTALSDPDPDDQWEGDLGFITESVQKYEASLENAEAYLCGPPPMLDAAFKVLVSKGMKEENILFDKF